MDKEILTLEIIQKDVKKYFSRDLLTALIILPFFVLSSVMVVFLMTLLLNLVIQDKTALKIIGAVVLSLLGLVYLDVFLKTIRKRIKFAKSEIKITEDKLVGKIPQHGRKYQPTLNT
jgi:membrane protein implicated in regulation of membrane protease activity